MGPTKSSAGFLNFRIGLNTRSAFFERSSVAPDNSAHFLVVQVVRERRERRNGKEGENIENIRRLGDEAAIPVQDIGRILHWPQHRPGIVCVNGVRLEEKRSDDAEIAFATANCLEEIGIIFGVRGNEAAVGQHHID